jgi:hypothetical protein
LVATIGWADIKGRNGCYRKALARKFPSTDLEAEVLKQVALISGAGLLVSLVLMSYGLDLSPGFF